MSREKDVHDLLREAKDGNTDAANSLLAIAAGCLRSRDPMPEPLADFLADAYLQAYRTKQPTNGGSIEHARAARLAAGLYLTREPKRPRKRVPRGDLALAVAVFGGTVSERQLSAAVAKACGVSEGTARTRIKETKARMEAFEKRWSAALKAQGIESLARRR